MAENKTAASHTVTVKPEGIVFNCREDEFVLSAMIRAGCGPLTYGCCGGGCGFCKARVEAGNFEAVKKMSRAHVSEKEQQEGIVLLCCIQPRTNIVVTLI